MTEAAAKDDDGSQQRRHGGRGCSDYFCCFVSDELNEREGRKRMVVETAEIRWRGLLVGNPRKKGVELGGSR